MNYSLILSFRTSDSLKSTITIDKVKSDITKEQISSLMDVIISQNAFKSSKGADFIQKESATLCQKSDTSYEF